MSILPLLAAPPPGRSGPGPGGYEVPLGRAASEMWVPTPPSGNFAFTPPSTRIIWPVMYSAIGDARKRIARAMSSGRPGRCNGVVSLSVATRSSDIVDIVAGVTIAPGDTAFARMPERPYSTASVFVRWMRPAFAAPYAEWFGDPKTPLIDVTLTIDPPPRASMIGMAPRHSQNT